MKIDVMNKEGMVLLSRSSGETLRVSLPEFWEIVRVGDRLDTREEIENYLADGGEFEGVDADTIRGNQAFLDEVVEKLIESRLSNENRDQAYEAICYCVKYGKHKDELFAEKSLEDMDVADFKDPERRREFNGLLHAYRDLTRQMHAENEKPLGGDRNAADLLKLRLRNVTATMDLLRVKEWLSNQPYDLNTTSPQYREAMDMLKMKDNGHYLGNNIGDACRRIADIKQQIFDSFQEGRSTYELAGWDRGSVVVYCDCDLFTDEKVHFVTEESKFFYDMERNGQGPAHKHIAEKLTQCVMAGELSLCEGGSRQVVEASACLGEVDSLLADAARKSNVSCEKGQRLEQEKDL